MKILFLHLSDLHIKSDKAYCEFQIKKIIDSLRTAGSFDRLLFVLSGDIAFSGEREQYRVANGILNKMSIELKKKNIYTSPIETVCVPGNHDIQFENPPRTAEELNQIYTDYSYKKYLEEELSKQANFFNFAKTKKCFIDDTMFSQKIIDFDGFKIEINMLNTGLFSLKSQEDKGLHYIDQSCINKLNTPTGANFVISVMHHSYDWYIDSLKEQLEQALLCKSSLIFLGHEHRIATKQSSRNQQSAVIHAGGSLCNDDDWTQSAYEYGVLDTNTYTYTIYPHKWDSQAAQYNNDSPIVQTLTPKPSIEKKLTVRDEYKNNLLSDPLRSLSADFTDYFVFPRIETETYGDELSKEFLNIDPFIEELYSQKRVLITGANGCGKTSLLKALFLKLSEEKCVIYCDIDTIKNKESSKIVKSNFEEIYGDDKASLVRYNQLPPENRVLIIDDIDQIKPRDFDRYISSLTGEFGLMIFATKKVIDLDMLERMKTALKTETAITKYKIAPFFSDKRKELVEKVILIKQKKDASLDAHDLTEKLCEAINLQKKFISLTPDFIIDFVDYYCNNIGNISNSDSTVFGKVFEANITAILSPYQTGILTTDKIYRLISMVAHYIHFNKKYPISEKEILSIISTYNEDNDDEVTSSSFLRIIQSSKILTESENGYKFVNKNQLAYFVAREVNFLYNTTGVEDDLNYLLQNACFGINADILMFISYITDNPRILGFLLSTTQALTSDWQELNFNTNLPKFLELKSAPALPPPPEDGKQEAEKKEVSDEKQADKQLTTVDIYDYNEDDASKTMNQIIRALSLLMIISKCLPSFEHNMNAQMRKAFVNEIYQLPNKIYNVWAKETERDYEQIIEELKKEGPVEYEERRKPGQLSRLQVEFQLVSMALLLDIYNMSATYATRDNSFRLLHKFDYSSEETYQIQHLMMLEKQKMAEDFVSNAITMYESSDKQLKKMLTKIVVRHAMVYMDALDFKKRDQLKSSFFPSRQEQQSLLAKRVKEGDHKE